MPPWKKPTAEKRKVAWFEVFAGQSAKDKFDELAAARIRWTHFANTWSASRDRSPRRSAAG